MKPEKSANAGLASESFDGIARKRSRWEQLQNEHSFVVTNLRRHGLLSALAVVLTIAACQGQDATYVWTSFDGNPDGIFATLVLSSPSYSGDFDPARIVSVTLSSAVSGTYDVNVSTDLYGWSSFVEWNPAGISEMMLAFSPGNPAPSWFLVADQNHLFGFNPYYPAWIAERRWDTALLARDYSGAWVGIPEPASGRLIVFGLMLVGVRYVSRENSKRIGRAGKFTREGVLARKNERARISTVPMATRRGLDGECN